MSYDSYRVPVSVTLDGVDNDGAPGEGDRLRGINGAYGGFGDDVLVGDAGANFLAGQNGDDRIVGGLGPDYLDGGEGSDFQDSRDLTPELLRASLTTPSRTVADLLRCTGEDQVALIDAADDAFGCRTLVTPLEAPVVTDPRRRSVRVPVTCPGSSACSGRVRLELRPPARGATTSGRRALTRARTLRLDAGERRTVRLPLNALARRLLRRTRQVKARATFSIPELAGRRLRAQPLRLRAFRRR